MLPPEQPLLEERYKQLEKNFDAVVAELRGKESSGAQLPALLARLEADMKHSLLRSEASGAGSVQRLEEREAILQRNFAAVVELLGPSQQEAPAPAPSPATPGSDSEGSPFSQNHPWAPKGGAVDEGGAYAAPPTASRRTIHEPSSATSPSPGGTSGQVYGGSTASPSAPLKRYDSFPSYTPPGGAPSGADAAAHTNGVSEREAALQQRLEAAEAELAELRRLRESEAEEAARVVAAAKQTEERLQKWEERQQARAAARRSVALIRAHPSPRPPPSPLHGLNALAAVLYHPTPRAILGAELPRALRWRCRSCKTTSLSSVRVPSPPSRWAACGRVEWHAVEWHAVEWHGFSGRLVA